MIDNTDIYSQNVLKELNSMLIYKNPNWIQKKVQKNISPMNTISICKSHHLLRMIEIKGSRWCWMKNGLIILFTGKGIYVLCVFFFVEEIKQKKKIIEFLNKKKIKKKNCKKVYIIWLRSSNFIFGYGSVLCNLNFGIKCK